MLYRFYGHRPKLKIESSRIKNHQGRILNFDFAYSFPLEYFFYSFFIFLFVRYLLTFQPPQLFDLRILFWAVH